MLEKICKKEVKSRKEPKLKDYKKDLFIQELLKSLFKKEKKEKEEIKEKQIEKEVEEIETEETGKKAITRAYETSKMFWESYINKGFKNNVYIPHFEYNSDQKDFQKQHQHVETIYYDEIEDMARTMASNNHVHPSIAEAYKIWSWFTFNRPLRKIYFGIYKVEKFSA